MCADLHYETGEHDMKVEFSKEWCLRMAELEGDAEIEAGSLAADVAFEAENGFATPSAGNKPHIAFARFVRLMRRECGLSLTQLALEADVDVAVLVQIENDPRGRPSLHTTCQLANYFGISQSGLMQLSGVTALKDATLADEAARFVARSEPASGLNPEESKALKAFVAVLGVDTCAPVK